jgi:hypothetical protein
MKSLTTSEPFGAEVRKSHDNIVQHSLLEIIVGEQVHCLVLELIQRENQNLTSTTDVHGVDDSPSLIDSMLGCRDGCGCKLSASSMNFRRGK